MAELAPQWGLLYTAGLLAHITAMFIRDVFLMCYHWLKVLPVHVLEMEGALNRRPEFQGHDGV